MCVPCAQPCLTLSDPMDCSPPGSSVHGFPRQEYWSGLPCLHRGDLSNPEIKPTSPVSPALQVDSLPTEPSGKPNIQWSNLWFYDAFSRNPTSNGEFWSLPGLVIRGPKDPLALLGSSKPQFPKDNGSLASNYHGKWPISLKPFYFSLSLVFNKLYKIYNTLL